MMRGARTWFALATTSARLRQDILSRRDRKRLRPPTISKTPATTPKPASPPEVAKPPADIGQFPDDLVDILQSLPEEKRTRVYQALSFSGPVPPPAMYAGYEEVLPGSADRIMRMAEKEQDHRIAMDLKYVEIYAGNTHRSQKLSVVVILAGLAAAMFLGIFGDVRASGGVLALLAILQVIHRIWQKASRPPGDS